MPRTYFPKEKLLLDLRTFGGILALIAVTAIGVLAQKNNGDDPGSFRAIVEKRLQNTFNRGLATICPIDQEISARTIFADYGAIFVSNSEITLPSRCIFETDGEVQAFQDQASARTEMIGGVRITLQEPAMNALLKARKQALAKGLNITARGGSLAATRSFYDTVRLWNSRLNPGLAHWVARGKIKRAEAEAIKNSPIPVQIAKVLEWERNGIWFSKDLSKSILYSVAAPGASQHVFMVALDINQFANKDVRSILAQHGWFQTVNSDLPHFTYLGQSEDDLPAFGLKSVTTGGQNFWIPNIDK